MSSRKIQVVESEKSPKVLHLNWMLEVVLGKNKGQISRCERAVTNRVTVDQKIMYKKFLTKVNRTKLSHARATGNKALASDIMEKTTFVLNTNVGNDDDETLKRIWRAGTAKYERLTAKPSQGKGSSDSVEESKVQRSKSAAPLLQRYRDPNQPLRPWTTVSVAKPTLDKRPKTAGPSVCPQGRRVGRVDPVMTADDGLTTGYLEDNQSDHANDNQPFLETLSSQYLEETAPRSRRGSQYRRESDGMYSLGQNFSLTDLHKMWVGAKDYEGQVRKFGDSIKPLKAGKRNVTDYYTLRASEHAHSARKKSVWNIPGTPPSEYSKDSGKSATGNMTFREIDWNFEKRPSTFVDVTAF